MAMWSRKYGYTDLGPVVIPPKAQWFILTDRADGVTEWLLSYNSGLERATTTDTLPTVDTGYILRFGPYDGPYLAGNPRIRLFVRSGILGYDYEPLPQGISGRDQPRVLIRLATGTTYYEITIPDGWAPSNGLGLDTEPALP